ncbi:hypothetical protein INT48_000729 [Thamnidium elegans]|uniref:Uncharacterized protein n=1 Tax=Thamnidium elegans TaxID=101142 RepID=A0A8H7SYK2_9FUNG|nr:hypothetical protein INT48_000729 [Thamnidium elegans]
MFIDRMLENSQEHGGSITEGTEEVVYKKSGQNSGPKSSFTTEHNELLGNDPVIFRKKKNCNRD